MTTATMKRPSFDAKQSLERCKALRRRILELSQKVSALHVGGAFSAMEMVEAIYFSLMRRDQAGSSVDTFLMSKGHGCMAQYVALELLGTLSRDHLDQYCKRGGILGAHPDLGNPGIEASTGSLGHGLTLAVGMAYADKVANADRDIFVVMSDGEFQEGSVWEALMIAGNLSVTRLCAFLDLNDRQSFAQTSKVNPNFYPIRDKIASFGWETVEIDGHDSRAIVAAVQSRSGKKPFCVIGKTIKGKGISFMENVPIWHYRSPNADEYQQALKELGF